jgi:hypothetical protein
MSRFFVVFAIACLAMAPATRSGAATVTVDPGAPWLGFMNVFELPSNGGGYAFGSGWGVADLRATFSSDVLTLAPNTIGDPSAYWYVGGGAPGNPGNKIMDASFYVEDDSLNGETVTFVGNVLANSLTSSHTAVAFIKDFASDYSSSVGVSIPLTPGPFSISWPTLGAPGRHIQFGFTMNGPNVWATDVAPFGSVQIVGVPEPMSLALAGASLVGSIVIRGRRQSLPIRR